MQFISLNKAIDKPSNFNEINIINGKVEFYRGNFDGARKIVETILDHDSLHAEAIRLKSLIIQKVENTDCAINYLTHIIKTKISHDETLLIQNAEFIKIKDGIDAAIRYLRAREEFSVNPKLLLYTAKLLESKGDHASAFLFGERALNQDAENAEVLRSASAPFGKSW